MNFFLECNTYFAILNKYSASSLIRPCWASFFWNYGRICLWPDKNKISLFLQIIYLNYIMNVYNKTLRKQRGFLAFPINNKGSFIVPLAFAQAFIVTLSIAFFVPFGRLCTEVKVYPGNILKYSLVSSQLKIWCSQ